MAARLCKELVVDQLLTLDILLYCVGHFFKPLVILVLLFYKIRQTRNMDMRFVIFRFSLRAINVS